MPTLNENRNPDSVFTEAISGISRAAEKPSAAYQYFQSAPQHYHHHAHHMHHHGFCHNCCHPMHSCCCNRKECQKVCKELLVEATGKELTDEQKKEIDSLKKQIKAMQATGEDTSELEARLQTLLLAAAGSGSETAIIGGGCCVHLSVEYMRIPSVTIYDESGFVVEVRDTEATKIQWGKGSFKDGYHIKEDIITTNPGAALIVKASNAIVRVRWCEVFSG